ncbi:hypothetical protein GCM10022408_32250 [Hymenobacter fastidiosus]|uniref:Uncharacterized protein n=1 Tax=Hymenobacter fastidiosus TaxID=486264 RepID=A0ABP7SU22_9BACT
MYPVGNLPQARAGYCAVLEQEPCFDESFYIGFNVGGYEPGLIPDGAVAGPAGPVTYRGGPAAQAAYDRRLALGAHAHAGRRTAWAAAFCRGWPRIRLLTCSASFRTRISPCRLRYSAIGS